jgi:hypothetical protein
MALINCKECGKEISDTARSCPYCGFHGRQKKLSLKEDMFQITVVSILGVSLIALTMLIFYLLHHLIFFGWK